jgi:hypothetical protein
MNKTVALLAVSGALLALSACVDHTTTSPLSPSIGSASASANTNTGLKLHPEGFGQQSFAAWQAHQGLPDSKGNADAGLYFQKMTTTATFAAGVAKITGLEGQPLSASLEIPRLVQ